MSDDERARGSSSLECSGHTPDDEQPFRRFLARLRLRYPHYGSARPQPSIRGGPRSHEQDQPTAISPSNRVFHAVNPKPSCSRRLILVDVMHAPTLQTSASCSVCRILCTRRGQSLRRSSGPFESRGESAVNGPQLGRITAARSWIDRPLSRVTRRGHKKTTGADGRDGAVALQKHFRTILDPVGDSG